MRTNGLLCHCKDSVFMDDDAIRGSNPFTPFSGYTKIPWLWFCLVTWIHLRKQQRSLICLVCVIAWSQCISFLLSEMLRIEGVTPILDVCVYNTWPVIQVDSQERFLRTRLSWWECSSLFINVGHFLKVIGHPSYYEKKTSLLRIFIMFVRISVCVENSHFRI